MAAEPVLTFSLASVVKDVLQQHGGRLDVNLASRKAEEASLRRYEAAGWLRKTVGVVGGKDLPAEPSEEDFRIGLRSGIILCNVLNKIQPGAVSKVVEGPCDSVIIPDGAALSVYQYFENVRNFLVAVEEMGLPSFEASDLEQGGKSSRIVNCVLALKSHAERKFGGGNGSSKYSGVAKPPTTGKTLLRKNSEPFMKSMWTMPSGDRDGYMSDPGHDLNERGSVSSLNSLVRQYLSDKKPEEIPTVVESLLSKVMEEFEHHMQIRQEMMEEKEDEQDEQDEHDLQDEQNIQDKQEENYEEKYNKREDSSRQILILKQQNIVETQNRSIQHLHSLASAASGYHKVLDENRKLYNIVQDLKGNIRVYCRVRPFLGGQLSHYSSVGNVEEGSISIITPSKYGKEGKKTFNFNRVFGPSATQGEVFADTQPLIRSVLDGYNVCIFAYGQTGSGKTFTMNLTSGSTIRGSMHLVDLAGSERADKTEATGDRMKEAQHINKSLSALGDVISSLAQKNAHVPYRNSKLTQLLQDSLGGQAKTLMFVHISPEPEALGETLSTLKFAERVSTVELGAARVNKDNSDVKELKEQIASLKAALARKEGGEAEHFQQSANSSSHEIPKLKSYASSPPMQRSLIGGARKLPKDDSSSLNGQKNAASKLKRRSLDLHDMRKNSPPWPPVRSHRKEDDKESISGDWVDKISINRNDSLTSDDSLVGQWETESKQSSPMLSPTFLSEPSKICMDHSLHRKDNQELFDMAITDESDELEIATSDSSESDLHWPAHIPKPITVSSGLGIKARKKPINLRPTKSLEAR
ncbi:hypothetical protein JHK87_054370 [Glycine soja]|nr:hypothetical protein JHK87_054370 [Glycine soja]